ncbi:HutD-family protein [Brucella oryzae]|uniref:HutD-family protein n=2 Tax=Brucella oryzae TaxID=335286 RepID=A0A2S7J448_9HYPH|nr:HutD family protein [Brucella oryzae]PQA75022.1 HutD-family protein [Brucella oryzae]
MMVDILRAENHRRMPWKNGGGVTVEIAVHPQGASVDDFDWRVSMATVASDGPFSVFPGIDRTLSVLEGDGIVLNIEGQQSTLTVESAPLFFAADAHSSARLIGSAITDLNVMTRRGRYTHKVQHLSVNGTTPTQADGNPVLLFCAAGHIDLTSAGKTTKLGKHDCAILTNCVALPLELNGKGSAYLISIGA